MAFEGWSPDSIRRAKEMYETGRYDPIKYSRLVSLYKKELDKQEKANATPAVDKELKATIEAFTGTTATPEQLAKYAQWKDNPALLQAVIGRDIATAPAQGKFTADIQSTVKNLLGRDATPSELNYFGKNMEQGAIDPYGLESFIKGTEEYQTGYTQKAREALKGELATSDQDYLNKVNTALQAKYAAQGRPGAGAFGSSLIQAGKDLASERGSYLANIGYQGAQQGLDTLKSQYQQNLNNMYNTQQGTQGLASESRNRYYSTQDAARQFDYQKQLMGLQNQYAMEQQKYAASQQPSFLEGLVPGLIGAAGGLGGSLIMANAYKKR